MGEVKLRTKYVCLGVGDRLEIQSENQDKAIPEVSIVTSVQSEKPEKPVEIMGTPIQVVYPLKMHGEVNRSRQYLL